ncbi:Clp protease N-terminal domain-containing protein [Microbacterium pumilum]|uniref:Clp protease N-terminal domain-containing protein n=1 Tax=Microbacterium pumilum TaxID=344165 RepID=A0ABP5E5G6_9MICO
MFERFAREARSAVEGARREAGRRGDRRIGTEHLLLALLHDRAVAQTVGVDATAAEKAADQLDRDALAAIGLTIGEFEPTGSAGARRVPRMTSGAKSVLQGALVTATAEKARAITSRHLLLALLDRHEPDPAAALLDALHVDPSLLRSRLTTAA